MDVNKLMLIRLLESGRVDMGKLQSLANDHKLKMADIVGFESNIAEN